MQRGMNRSPYEVTGLSWIGTIGLETLKFSSGRPMSDNHDSIPHLCYSLIKNAK